MVYKKQAQRHIVMAEHVFRLQVVSDLHLEQLSRKNPRWKEKLVQPVCDTIATLGDVCELQHEALWQPFFEYLAQNWRTVLVVNGNHEYHCDERVTVDVWKERQRAYLQQFPNVHILDNSEYVASTPSGRPVVIWGSTLWSRVPVAKAEEVQERIRDYHTMYVTQRVVVPGEEGSEEEVVEVERQLRVSDTNAWHEEAVRQLQARLTKDPECPLVVLSHHAPLLHQTSPIEFERDRNRALNWSFASDLSGLFRPHVKLWAFGHTHWPADFVFRTTRVISNPHGYGALEPCVASYRSDWVVDVSA